MIVLCLYVRVADMTIQLLSLQNNYQCYQPDTYQQTAGPTTTYQPLLCTLYLGQSFTVLAIRCYNIHTFFSCWLSQKPCVQSVYNNDRVNTCSSLRAYQLYNPTWMCFWTSSSYRGVLRSIMMKKVSAEMCVKIPSNDSSLAYPVQILPIFLSED